MTEAEWLTCTDPALMLTFLRESSAKLRWRRLFKPDADNVSPPPEWPITDRKLRLFAVACCRRIWHLITEPESQRAVEVAERYAEGLQPRSVLKVIAQMASRYGDPPVELWFGEEPDGETSALHAAFSSADESGIDAATIAAFLTAKALSGSPHPDDAERAAQCGVLRCIFGNPTRSLLALADPWLDWNDGAIKKLAASIHAERAFDRLPILADALEDAGCDNADVLAHCRQPGEHVRGCWIVDLLLGKE